MGRTQVGHKTNGRLALWAGYAVFVYTALSLAVLMGVANLIIFDHNVRWDLTPGKQFSLSRFDKHVLSGLRQKVKVIAFVTTPDRSYQRLADLLSRVAAFTPRVTYRIIDLNKSPAIAARYGVDTYGEVIVESGGRRRQLHGQRPELLIRAILEVSRGDQKKVATGQDDLPDGYQDSVYSGFQGRGRQSGEQSRDSRVTSAQTDALFYLGVVAEPALLFLVALAVFLRRRWLA